MAAIASVWLLLPGPGSVAEAAPKAAESSASTLAALRKQGAAAVAQGIQARDYFDDRGATGVSGSLSSNLQAQAPNSGVGMVAGGSLGTR